MDKYSELKKILTDTVEKKFPEIIALNDDLADNPELSGEEHRSSKKISEILEKSGFKIEMPFAGLETAFRGVSGKDNHKYKVAVMAEYDAIPVIGHASYCTCASSGPAELRYTYTGNS